MKKYRVCLIKYETYYVDAENEDDALDKAYTMDDNNWLAWSDPVDEVEVEEVELNETVG